MSLREVLRVLRSFVGNFLSFHNRLALYMMKNKIYRLNKIGKGIMKSPKILYYDSKTKKDS